MEKKFYFYTEDISPLERHLEEIVCIIIDTPNKIYRRLQNFPKTIISFISIANNSKFKITTIQRSEGTQKRGELNINQIKHSNKIMSKLLSHSWLNFKQLYHSIDRIYYFTPVYCTTTTITTLIDIWVPCMRNFIQRFWFEWAIAAETTASVCFWILLYLKFYLFRIHIAPLLHLKFLLWRWFLSSI